MMTIFIKVFLVLYPGSDSREDHDRYDDHDNHDYHDNHDDHDNNDDYQIIYLGYEPGDGYEDEDHIHKSLNPC